MSVDDPRLVVRNNPDLFRIAVAISEKINSGPWSAGFDEYPILAAVEEVLAALITLGWKIVPGDI